MKRTLVEHIERKLLSESETKIEELKPLYGWMAYAYDTDEYKASEIYKKKKLIVKFLKKMAEEYNSDKEKDLSKQFWNMIIKLKLSPQFWMWVDHNLDTNIYFNDSFDVNKKISAKFLWVAIILGKESNKDNVDKTKKDTERSDSDTKEKKSEEKLNKETKEENKKDEKPDTKN